MLASRSDKVSEKSHTRLSGAPIARLVAMITKGSAIPEDIQSTSCMYAIPWPHVTVKERAPAVVAPAHTLPAECSPSTFTISASIRPADAMSESAASTAVFGEIG